ncbi:hypothetical protein NKI46_10550 [Mesorhizobium sp. M0615]
MFETLGRFRAAMKNAQAVRAMNNLPPEIQKDIGWPCRRASTPRPTCRV